MATYSSEIETALKRYIDNRGGEGRDRLKELLKNTSVRNRYELLMNVKGAANTLTGPGSGAYADDLEIIKHMLDNFLAKQKFDVMKIQPTGKWTALHYVIS